MKETRYIRVILLISSFFLAYRTSGFCQSNETLTITTYYPSPYGAFRDLDVSRKLVFKDSGASPQDLELSTDGASNLVLNVSSNPTPLTPAQVFFNDTGGINPYSYTKSYNSSSGSTYCESGYLAVNFFYANNTPADLADLPSSGYFVCLRTW